MLIRPSKLIRFSFLCVGLSASLIGCGTKTGGFELAKDTSEETDNSATVATNARNGGPVIKDTVKLPAGRKIKK